MRGRSTPGSFRDIMQMMQQGANARQATSSNTSEESNSDSKLSIDTVSIEFIESLDETTTRNLNNQINSVRDTLLGFLPICRNENLSFVIASLIGELGIYQRDIQNSFSRHSPHVKGIIDVANRISNSLPASEKPDFETVQNQLKALENNLIPTTPKILDSIKFSILTFKSGPAGGLPMLNPRDLLSQILEGNDNGPSIPGLGRR